MNADNLKIRRATWAMLAVLPWLAGAQQAAAATPIPTGIWIWDDGRAAVEFHDCGKALCGRIVSVVQETGSNTATNTGPLLDAKNPDPGQRSRHICGLDYITGVKRTPNGDWTGGRVYDFNSGASYDLDIDSVDAGQVRMRGYKGVRLLGATLTLVRPKSAPPPCKADN